MRRVGAKRDRTVPYYVTHCPENDTAIQTALMQLLDAALEATGGSPAPQHPRARIWMRSYTLPGDNLGYRSCVET